MISLRSAQVWGNYCIRQNGSSNRWLTSNKNMLLTHNFPLTLRFKECFVLWGWIWTVRWSCVGREWNHPKKLQVETKTPKFTNQQKQQTSSECGTVFRGSFFAARSSRHHCRRSRRTSHWTLASASPSQMPGNYNQLIFAIWKFP